MKKLKLVTDIKTYKVFYLLGGILIFPISVRFITKISSIEYLNIQSLISLCLSFFLIDFVIKSSDGLFNYFPINLSNSFKFVNFILFCFGLALFIAIVGINIDFQYFIICLFIVSNALFFKNENKLNRKLLQLLNICVIYGINKYNNFFIFERQEIAGDVGRWQYPITEKIFNYNLLDVFANPIDDLGYWYINLLVFANFYFAFISKIVLLYSEFIPLQIIPSTLIVLFTIFIWEIDIKTKAKNLIIFLNIFILMINDWVRYLLIDSFMQEGVVSLFFVIIFYNFVSIEKLKPIERKILYLIIGFFIFSKLFIGIFILLMPFLFSKKVSWIPFIREYWPLSIGLLSLFSILIRYPKTNINDFPLTVDFSNMPKIFTYWVEDALFMYIILFSALFLIFYFKENKFKFPPFQSKILFLSLLNFTLIMVLYSTLWSSGEEYESSYRYYLQTYYLNLLLIGTIFNKFLIRR